MPFMRTSIVIAAMLAMGACTVGPNYHTPSTPTPAAYEEAAPGAGAPAQLTSWWEGFHDPELTSLVTRALGANIDIAAAVSKIRQARQQAIIAGAPAWPNLGAGAGVNNTKLAKNAGFSQITTALQNANPVAGGLGGIGLPGGEFTTYSTGFDASWELDLFGQTRRAEEAARARTDAQVWALRDAQVSVAAEVAVDYLTLRALQQQISVAGKDAERERRLVSLIEDRRRSAFASDTDVARQESQLQTALAAEPTLKAEADGEVHALGVLLGQPPESLTAELAAPGATPAVPPQVPVGLPSDLLRRRPDVRLAERRLAAATADQGVAVGDLYPKLNLTGTADLISQSLKTLISADSLQTVATAELTYTLLNGGKTYANIAATREARQQAYLSYEGAVLGALKDVEDALARYQAETQRNQSLRQAAAAAERAAGATQDRYRSGLGDLVDALNAEGALLSAQNALYESDGLVAAHLVSLYKALGGGWTGEAQAR
jgi:NodT family efflux transporter outer membrane factor (OMF) lipoprotein